jgi:hypothetical protein
MESFDIDTALLAIFSEFDPITLIVKTTSSKINEQLEWMEENLGGLIRDGMQTLNLGTIQE